MKDYVVNSLEDYIKTIHQINESKSSPYDLLFRGQCKNFHEWSLQPKLLRLKSRIKNLTKCELLLINEFKRNLMGKDFFLKNNEWDVLTLAQHYGLPTRLLDWSYFEEK